MYASRFNYVAAAAGILIAGAFVLLLGAMIALFPMGFMARVALLVAGLVMLLVFAITPSNAYTGWEERVGFTFLLIVVLLLVVWPRYLFVKLGPGPSVNGLTLALFGLLIYSIGALFRRKEIRARFVDNSRIAAPFLAFLLLFYLLRFISLFFGEYWLASTIDVLREAVSLLAVVLAGLAFTGRDGQERKLVYVLLISAAIATVAGIVELKVKHNLFARFVDLDAASSVSVNLVRSIVGKFRDGSYRVQSTFDHPIVMGQFFAMMFSVVAIAAALFKGLWRGLAIALLPATVVMIAKSGSRSGLVGLVVSAALLGCLLLILRIGRKGTRSPAETWWFFMIAAVGLIALVLFANVFSEAFDSILQLDRRSTEARVTFLNKALPSIVESPLVGYGFGMAAREAGLPGSDGYLTLDNYFLTLALDYGVPTVMAYCAMHLVPVWRSRKALSAESGDALIIISFAVSIVVFLLIQTILSIPNNQSIVVLMALTIMQLGRERQNGSRERDA